MMIGRKGMDQWILGSAGVNVQRGGRYVAMGYRLVARLHIDHQSDFGGPWSSLSSLLSTLS